VHVRRALLLFAIVLGLAALATSISRPPREADERERSPAAPQATQGPSEPEVARSEGSELGLPGPRGKRSIVVPAGEAVTVNVAVPEPGAVELVGLGLSSPAEPLTPARFDLLLDDPGAHRVRFTPAGGDPRSLGRIVARY